MNRQDLKDDDHVDDAMRSAELAMRLPEPVRKHAVLGNAIQHAVRADDRRIHRARQNQRSHGHHEHVERQPQRERPGQTHGQSADQILQILAARTRPE